MLQLLLLSMVIFQPIFLTMFYLLDPYNKRYPAWLFVNPESNALSKFLTLGAFAIICNGAINAQCLFCRLVYYSSKWIPVEKFFMVKTAFHVSFQIFF